MGPHATRFTMTHEYGLSTHTPGHIRVGPIPIFDKFSLAEV